MHRIVTLLVFLLTGYLGYSQIIVTPSTACAGSGSFQVTITGISPGQVPSSNCGNISSAGVTSNNNIVINASNIATSNGGTTVTATLSVPQGFTPGSYGFAINYACGAVNSCNSCFTVNGPPTNVAVSASGSVNICSGNTATLNCNATGATSYQWRLGGNTINNAISATYQASASGTYTCDAINSCGTVTSSNSVTVTVNNRPTVAPGSTVNAICTGGSATISANAQAGSGTISSYAWNTGIVGNLSGGTVSPASTTTYTVTVTNSNNCTSSGNIAITVNALPTVNPTANPQSVCTGQSTTLSAGASAGSGTISNYTWSEGLGNVSSGNFSPANTSNIAVTVTNSNNCSATGSVTVSVNDVPTVAPSANPPGICNGSGSSTLNANAVAGSGNITNYSWSAGPSGNVSGGVVSPATTTDYTITVTNSNNCTATGTVTVAVGATPTLAPTATPSAVCAGESSTLDANADAVSGTIQSYAWSSGISGNNQSGDVSPSGTTTYNITVTNTDNCSASAAVTLTVNENPTLAPTATPSSICTGESSTLEANATSANATITDYDWSSGIAGNVSGGQVQPTADESYTVTVTNSLNCSASAEVSVSVTPLPASPSISSAQGTTICLGDTAELSLNTTYNGYQWSTGATTAGISVTQSGNYNVTVSTACGQFTASDIAIVVSDPGVPTIAENVSIGIRAQSSTAVTYQWFLEGTAVTTATADSTYSPTESGNYTVEITDANGCKATSAPYNYVYLGLGNTGADVALTLMPNPAKNEVFIRTSLNSGFSGQITDLTGAVVKSFNATANSVSVNVESLSSGTYFVRITTSQGQHTTKRLIVE
jgi:hypothetical protein